MAAVLVDGAFVDRNGGIVVCASAARIFTFFKVVFTSAFEFGFLFVCIECEDVHAMEWKSSCNFLACLSSLCRIHRVAWLIAPRSSSDAIGHE